MYNIYRTERDYLIMTSDTSERYTAIDEAQDLVLIFDTAKDLKKWLYEGENSYSGSRPIEPEDLNF